MVQYDNMKICMHNSLFITLRGRERYFHSCETRGRGCLTAFQGKDHLLSQLTNSRRSKTKDHRPTSNEKTKDQRSLSSADQKHTSILTSVHQSIRPASSKSKICSLFRFILPTIPKTDVLPNQMIMNGCHKI